MWKSTEVDEARPLMVWSAGNTCFNENEKVVLGSIATEPNRSTSFNNKDAVTPDVVGLQTTISVTTAVTVDGVVYRVVDAVAAAVRERTFETTGI